MSRDCSVLGHDSSRIISIFLGQQCLPVRMPRPQFSVLVASLIVWQVRLICFSLPLVTCSIHESVMLEIAGVRGTNIRSFEKVEN